MTTWSSRSSAIARGSMPGSATAFSSPIIVAGWRQRMAGLGFTPGSDTSIESILAAVESGRTRVWITGPAQLNSGATVLLGTPLTLARQPRFQPHPVDRPLESEHVVGDQVGAGARHLAAGAPA